MIVKNIILNPQITTGRIGQVLFFGYTIEPNNASDKRIEITSSDPEIIDVQGNSFRFIREGFSTITIRSLDNGFRRDFVVSSVSSEEGSFNGLVREAEYDIKNYKEEMKRELQKDKEIIKSELSVFEENTKKLIESEREKIINDFKNVNDSNLDEINKHVNSKINEIISISKDAIIELNSTTNLSKKDLEAKIKELNAMISSMYDNINKYILEKQEEMNIYTDTVLEATKTEINNHALETLSEIQNKYRDIISNIESSENFALSNIEIKFTDAVAYIESVEATSVNNIEHEKDRLIGEIREEVSEISNIIQSETENAVQIILNKEAEAISEITKLEITIKSTINVELERATSVIASELTSVIDTMNEHCRALMNQLTEHKNNLMGEIAVDKDNMLLELEREKNRLIQLIRSEEANLFKNLHETQQEIINNIQTTVQGYDVELEAIKNEKIQSIQVAVNGYDVMITEAKIAAQESVTNLGNAFSEQLTSEKNSHVAEMQVKKNTLSGELASEKGSHSTNLTAEYNTHKNALDNQVNNSNTGLKKQLSDDYSTHSSNLSKEKTSHSNEISNLKNNSVTEITTLKNSALDEIGRNTNQGQWKIVRDSIIATGLDEKGKVTAEGTRIQELLLGIENNIVQQGNSALTAIGTSDSTGKRGEAISSIETHKTNAVNMIGTSNSSMNGSSPSVRKDAYDSIVSAKNSSVAEINTVKINKVNEADVEITAIKNTANSELEANKNKHITTLQDKADELQGNLNANGSVTNVGDTLVRRDTNGDIFVRNISGTLKGNADTATKLSASKTITFTGDVTGSFSFDGSGNVSAVLTHKDTSNQASITSTSPTMLQNIALDGNGHVTGVTTYNLDNRYYTKTISDSKERWKNRGVTVSDHKLWANSPDSGVYTINNVGVSSTLAMFNNGGSAGSTGIEMQYGGAMFMYTNIDSNVWEKHRIWTSSIFDPDSKLSKTGDTMTGALSITNNAPVIALNETDTGKIYHIVADNSGFRINENGSGSGINVIDWLNNTLRTSGNFVSEGQVTSNGIFESHANHNMTWGSKASYSVTTSSPPATIRQSLYKLIEGHIDNSEALGENTSFGLGNYDTRTCIYTVGSSSGVKIWSFDHTGTFISDKLISYGDTSIGGILNLTTSGTSVKIANPENGYTELFTNPTAPINGFLGGIRTKWYGSNGDVGFCRDGSTGLAAFQVNYNGSNLMNFDIANRHLGVAGTLYANSITTGGGLHMNSGKFSTESNGNFEMFGNSLTISGSELPGFEIHKPGLIAYKTIIDSSGFYGVFGSNGAGNTAGNRLFGVNNNGDVYASSELYARNSQKVYHQGFKPTAADVGALSTSGGTLTGRLDANAAIKLGTTSDIIFDSSIDCGDIIWRMDSIEKARIWSTASGGLIFSCAETPVSQMQLTKTGNLIGTASATISGFGKVYNAIYNDYAELFPKKEGYITEAGDIIALCNESDEEVYVKATEDSICVVGAHSDEYAHLIGGEEVPDGEDFAEWNGKRYIPVGLVGRLHVKFKGVAKKGIKVVPSSIPGVGRAYDPTKDDYDKVIGYIVENNSEEGVRRIRIKIGK